MAISSAQRQKAYRTRRATAGDNGERRLQTWVSCAADLALDRLARHAHTSRRAVLEKLILDADTATGQGLSDEAFERYLALPCHGQQS